MTLWTVEGGHHRPLCQVKERPMRTFFLVPHIAAGLVGLGAGALALLAPKRRGRHVRAGTVYQGATVVLSTSSVGLVALDPSLWWLGLIAVATQVAAGTGWLVARRRPAGWLVWHVNLLAGSYVSFVTAFLVVNIDSIAAWIVPTLVASPLIARASARAAQSPANRGRVGRRPSVVA
jgi:hypothetical protein